MTPPNGARPAHGPQHPFEWMDRTRFPVDEWRLVETAPDPRTTGRDETLFAVGNGYLGMRGNPAEGRPVHTHGTYVNGFHETWPIQHAELAYGFAETGQTIIHAPDSKIMKIYVDDEPLVMSTADLERYERSLDFVDGQLHRKLLWRTPSGKRVQVDLTRMVSFTERHVAIMSVEITMLDGAAPVVVSSQVLNRQDRRDDAHFGDGVEVKATDPRRSPTLGERVLEPRMDWHEDDRMVLGYRAAHSGMTIAVAADHDIVTDNDYSQFEVTEADVGKKIYRVEAEQGRPITITKAVSYHTSRSATVRELATRCERTLDRVRQRGVELCRRDQREWLDDYWRDVDVVIGGRADLQQAVRWNLFQLAQATARSDQLGIAAKGVTGNGYEGHYFWDTEVYVVPFLVHTRPQVAHNVLRSRVGMLAKARERAVEMSGEGALFAWRTINGEEASAQYAAGTAQYHINADIAHALGKYVDLTGDTGFLARDGVEILVETARMWLALGFWKGQGSERSFQIHGVTGPDEYTTVVDNNLFTNVMARENLRRAADAVDRLDEISPEGADRTRRRLGLREDEPARWRECAEGMHIPYNEELGVHPQDERFLEREMWDLSTTGPEQRPLLLHFHPLVIYRFQVLKQADVVLALFLQGDEFTAEEKRRDFDYYDPITTGDSSLSAVVQSIIAAEVGLPEAALLYFEDALFTDLSDVHGNADQGVHVASSGGVWTALTHGFAGMRGYDGQITFDPRLPQAWHSLTFPIRVRGTRVRVHLTATSMSVTVETGPEFAFAIRGTDHVARPGEPVTVTLADHRHTPLEC